MEDVDHVFLVVSERDKCFCKLFLFRFQELWYFSMHGNFFFLEPPHFVNFLMNKIVGCCFGALLALDGVDLIDFHELKKLGGYFS